MKNLFLDKNTFKFILKEGMINRIICIFPGRFQPFAAHHYRCYNLLVDEFGEENVFVATSDVSGTEDNPFNFEKKRKFIKRYQIPDSQIKLVKNPYKCEEITSLFPGDSTAVVFAYGEKDSGRIKFNKVDGTPGYFKPWTSPEGNLVPYSLNGYIYVLPTVMDGLQPASSTVIRQKMNENFWIDVKNESGSSHLMHLWENEDFTQSDLLEIFIKGLTGKLENCVEKFDGQNLRVTFKDGVFKAARNKTTLKQPMSIPDVIANYPDLPEVARAFCWVLAQFEKDCKQLGLEKLNSIFKNGQVFLNVEVIYPDTANVIVYDKPMIVLHNFAMYDESGNEIGRNLKTLTGFVENINSEYIRLPNKLQFNVEAIESKISKLTKDVESLWARHGLRSSATLGELYRKIQPAIDTATSIKQRQALLRETFKVVEPLVMSFSTMVLNSVSNWSNQNLDRCIRDIRQKLAQVQTKVSQDQNPDKKKKLALEMSRINQIGLDNLIPAEGLVFSYEGNLYKLTGLFAPVNQILGLYRYSR